MLLNVYAYKELNGDVIIYHDDLGKKVFAKFDKNISSVPTKRNKIITLNCWQWNLNWITHRITTFEEHIQKRLTEF